MAWFRIPNCRCSSDKENLTTFSIIIPMRNESKTIVSLLQNLNNLSYPKSNYEIIVVDDASEDDSWDKVEVLEISNLTLVKSKFSGKKGALKTALEFAKNDYIIQTDADCQVDKQYLECINTYLSKTSPKLLLAPVIFKPQNSVFEALQELDFMALMMITAGTAKLNRPVMANGANLIYPKTIISDSDIFNAKVGSGDDMFLLSYVKKKYGAKSIQYLKSKLASIQTLPQTKLKDLFYQRVRWASKSKHYRDVDILTVGFVMFLVNILLFGFFIGSFFQAWIWDIFISVFLIKMLIDSILLFPILKFYNRRRLFIYLPILSFVYLFYISFVGVISPFINFEWKNRYYSS